tara:strand:- start:108 stop:1478 length:1371 start_codon:yes stop_codon:yes gene_type:complete
MTGTGRAFAQHPKAPNIVFIMADDLGYGDLSCYGRPDFTTPNTDMLAANGVRLLQAYSNSPVCSATRTALMTGQYQYRHRVGLEEPLLNSRKLLGLPTDIPTLPSLLKSVGYTTTLLGKWHLGLLPDFGPLKSGYDHFYGLRGGIIDYYTHATSAKELDLWDNATLVRHTGYLTELLGSKAVDTINTNAKSDTPFFLSLHFTAPHWPWEAPGDQMEAERLKSASLFHFDGGSTDTYRRMVQAMDIQVGRVLQALRLNRLEENTIVVFTSDNGGERFSYTWPFTGLKTELLEGGLRVPAIISWPAKIPQGRTDDQMMITMDWVPTLLAAAGVQTNPTLQFDGINLLPILTQGSHTTNRKFYWRYKSNSQRAMRDGDFKYLKILDNTFLFNITDDPMERGNLKERHRDVYDRMAMEWEEWNGEMLPDLDEIYVENFSGEQLADHIGSAAVVNKSSSEK